MVPFSFCSSTRITSLAGKTCCCQNILLRLTQVLSTVNGDEVNKAVYNYGAASRLAGVSNGVYSAHYEYEPNSPLVNKVVFKDNGTVRQTTTRQFDSLNRLTLMSNAPSASLPLTYAYLYNMANQRTQMNLGDGSYWKYNYDSMGQLTSGRRYWRDNTQVAGQQYTYSFDDIGNRKQTQTGGDNSGGGLNQAYWYTGPAHQQTARNVPGYIDVMGIANGSATVTVNGQSTTRKNEYYHRSVAVNNSSAPVYQTIDVAGVLEGTSQTKTGNVFVPQNSEQLSYDVDGNLIGDGRWDYTWDAENRLIRMQAKSSVPNGAKRKLEFEYDYQGRRTRKVVYDWQASSSSYVLTVERRYIYDGWNLLAEVDRNNSVVGSYTWGIDLSGSREGAGGVGGLLMVSSQFPVITRNFVSYDGNGNVTGVVDASNGTNSAIYEYGPFGEPIRVSGTMGKANPFRWSTKYTDEETDLVYYGYRYYSPVLGRWLSRDPIGEEGGINLFGFVRNNPTTLIDSLGLAEVPGTYNIDSKTRDVTVNDGTIVIVYGHQDPDKPWRFIFRGKCGAGAAVVCFPGLTNNKIPLINRIEGAPTHNDWMYFYGGLTSTGQKQARRELRNPETDGDRVLQIIKDNARKKAKEICNRCCTLKQVTIHYHRNAAPSWLPTADMNIVAAPKDEIIQCSPSKKGTSNQAK